MNCRPCSMCEAAPRLTGIVKIFSAGECLSDPAVELPDVEVSLVPTAGADRPFMTFRANGLTFMDDRPAD